MVKKLLTILITLILLTGIFYARQITFNEAQIVAENWTVDLEKKFNDQVRIFNGREILRENIIVAYVFDLYPKGFVIIAPQDYLPPIKMYSTESNFEGSGGPLNDIIFKSNLKIIQAVDKGDLSPEKNFSDRNKKVFERYLRGDLKYDTLSTLTGVSLKENSLQEDITQEVGPLLTTTWGQGGVYGEYCPNKISGCNATSFSQIFNYYEWPIRGSGSETYYDLWSGETLTANFDKEYEWWNMLDEYGSGTDEEEEAVSTLMFDIGVAMHTAYNGDASSANPKNYMYNFIGHFLYSQDMRWVRWFDYSSDDMWFDILKNQISNGWPFELGVSSDYFGHSVVIDGYRVDNNTKVIHVNFGWNGSYNGYYSFDNLYLSETLNFSDQRFHSAIINIYPYPEYKKPVGLPPQSITTEAFLNRSVFLSEYVMRISWSESPSQDKRIQSYIIYQMEDGSIVEIDRVDTENKTYEIRTKELSGVSYSVGVIDKNGVTSDIPAFVTPVLK